MTTNPADPTCIADTVRHGIRDATNLDDLLDLLNRPCPAKHADHCFCSHLDLSNLPTFSGVEPADTSYPIWSWDPQHYLVGPHAPFEIVPRSDVDTPPPAH